MSWKNVRLTDVENNRTIFGTLDFYTDGTIHVISPLTLSDKAKASARTIAKHPAAAISVVGVVVKISMGIPSLFGTYMTAKRVREASRTYQKEKENITVMKGIIQNIGRLEASVDEQEGIVNLTGDGRRYTIYFNGRFVAKTFAEAFRMEAQRYPGA